MTTETKVALEPLAYAGRLRAFLEKARVGVQVHLSHLKLQGRADPLAESVLPKLVAIEDEIEGYLKHAAGRHPVWDNWASKVKGCGLMTLGAVMSRVDIKRVNTVSAMWAHFGFAPGQKREAGKKLDYDAVGRTWCWRLGDSLIKQNGVFKRVYDERKAYEEAQALAKGQVVRAAKKGDRRNGNGPDEVMTKMHLHRRAMRYMIKRFLACLWLEWREAEDLPLQAPYIIGRAYGNGRVHQTFITPAEMTDR